MKSSELNFTVASIRNELFKMQDLKYRSFNSKLIPNIEIESIIGVRTPNIKKLAKKLYKENQYKEFIEDLPHKYFDEYVLHSHILNLIKDYNSLIEYVDKFLPYIDNWAVCDSLGPKILKKYPNEVYEKILVWIDDEKTYTKRFGIVTLMSNYLDENYKNEHLELISSIKSEEYYVNMAIAWYFSYAIIKQYDDAIKVIEAGTMEKFVHNKAIQKSIESLRVDKNTKEYLKTLRKK